jgi:anti-sigma factor RsiW
MARDGHEQRPDTNARMSDLHARFRDLAAARLDWGLTDAEGEDFGAHIATCQACRRYAASLTADAELLEGLPESDAPADLHLRLWTQLREPR